MTLHAWVLVSLAAGLAAPAGAPPGPRSRLGAHVETLADGTELVVLPIQSAGRISLRYVVRAGAAFDPPGRPGLAHLVEHVIAGARDGSERLLDEVAAAGGEMNALTSREATWYVLDAPAARFPALARKLLGAVTDPVFDPAEVAAALGVVDSEAQEVSEGGGYLGDVSDALFPEGGGTLLGTSGSRVRVTRNDMLEFYRERYVTSATTVIFAGEISPDEARALVEGTSALPPALPTEGYGPRTASPTLPTEQEARAAFHAVVVGYRLDEADWNVCRSAAELVNLRVTLRYQLERPVLPWAEVACHRLRGVPFMLAAGYARSLDEQDSLPEILSSAYRAVIEQPMTARERRLLEQRMGRAFDRLRDSPSRLADAAAALAAAPREAGATPIARLEAPLASAAALRAFASRTFVPDRRVSLTFTPY